MEQDSSGDAAVDSFTDCSPLQMLQFQLVVLHLALVIALLWWNSNSVLLAEAAPEVGEGFWWLSRNCPSLGIFSCRVRKTLEYPNTAGRWRISIDSVRVKGEP